LCKNLFILNFQNNYIHVSFEFLPSIAYTLHAMISFMMINWLFLNGQGYIKTKTYNNKAILIIKLIIPIWHPYLNLKQSILKQGKQNTRKSRFWCTKIRISAKSSYSIFRLSLMKQILWTGEMTFLSYICLIK